LVEGELDEPEVVDDEVKGSGGVYFMSQHFKNLDLLVKELILCELTKAETILALRHVNRIHFVELGRDEHARDSNDLEPGLLQGNKLLHEVLIHDVDCLEQDSSILNRHLMVHHGKPVYHVASHVARNVWMVLERLIADGVLLSVEHVIEEVLAILVQILQFIVQQ
jgi:hypothetical protein